jgi:hypothetical protein
MKKIFLFVLLLTVFVQQINSQCTNCTNTYTNATINTSFSISGVICFSGTTNTIQGDISSIDDESVICVGPGTTLNLNSNNYNVGATNNITVNVYGTLKFNTNPNLAGRWTFNIYNGGVLNYGSLGFNSTSGRLTINNAGTFSGGKLEITGNNSTGSISNTGSMTLSQDLNFAGTNFSFYNNSTTTLNLYTIALSNSSSTFIMQNHTVMNVTSTLNLYNGTGQFRNLGSLTVGQDYNSSSTSTYVNCGNYNGRFNLNGGGKVINTGTFNTGQVDYGGTASRIENYGYFNISGNVNLGGPGSVFYNQGIVTFTSGQFQSDGNLTGPSNPSYKGYFVWSRSQKAGINNGTIGPNLNFRNPEGASSAATMFNNPNSLTWLSNITWGQTEPTSLPSLSCPNADGSPEVPIPSSSSVCAGTDLTTLQPTATDVTYEWWTGSSTSRGTQITTLTTPKVTCYTNVGTIYLWAKSNGFGVYSNSGAPVSVTDCALAWRSIKSTGNWLDTNMWEYYNGSNWITIASHPYNNAKVFIKNGTNVTISSNLTINADSLIIEERGILTVNNGTTLTVNKPLVFKIDVNGNAGQLLGACNGVRSNVIMGANSKLIARRTLDDSWDFVSFPFEVSSGNIFFAGTSTSALWGNLNQSGTNVDFFAAEYSGANRANDASLVSPTNSKYFVSVNPQAFLATKGYIITGGKQNVPKTIDFVSSTGTQLDFCNVNKTVYAYDAIGACNDGWNLVGIPYPADFNLKYATSLAPYYVYGTNSYSTIAPNTTYRFNPFSAFFLQVFGASNATLTYDNTGLTDFTSGGAGGAPAYRLEDIVIEISDGSLSDNTLIRLQESATESFDTNMDGIKFLNSNTAIPQIYTEAEGACSGLAVNTLPNNTEMVNLKIRTGKIGTYNIRLSEKSQLNNVDKVILTDTETGISSDLLISKGYNFESNQTGTSSRFKVLLSTESANGIMPVKNNGIFAIVQGARVIVSGITEVSDISIYDAVGKLIQHNNSVINGEILELHQQGLYVMEISNKNQRARIKVLVSQKN